MLEGKSELFLDELADKYMVRRTVELDQLYSALNDTYSDNSKVNRKSNSAWGLVAQVPEEEFIYNEDLKQMLWYEQNGDTVNAKKMLRKYLADNPRFRMANV